MSLYLYLLHVIVLVPSLILPQNSYILHLLIVFRPSFLSSYIHYLFTPFSFTFSFFSSSFFSSFFSLISTCFLIPYLILSFSFFSESFSLFSSLSSSWYLPCSFPEALHSTTFDYLPSFFPLTNSHVIHHFDMKGSITEEQTSLHLSVLANTLHQLVQEGRRTERPGRKIIIRK